MELSKVCVQLLWKSYSSNWTLKFSVLTIWFGVTLASQRAIGRGYAAILMFIPALLGAILVNTLPSHNKVGLLFSYWISSELLFQRGDQVTHVSDSLCIYTFCDTSGMGWIYCRWPHKAYARYPWFFISAFNDNVVWISGITTNSIILGAYAIGNAAGPFMWKKQYQPRYATLLTPWSFKPQPSFFPAITSLGRSLRRALVLVPWWFLVFATYLNLRTVDGMARNETRPMMTYILHKKQKMVSSLRNVLTRYGSTILQDW